jgi:hypothetical protein
MDVHRPTWQRSRPGQGVGTLAAILFACKTRHGRDVPVPLLRYSPGRVHRQECRVVHRAFSAQQWQGEPVLHAPSGFGFLIVQLLSGIFCFGNPIPVNALPEWTQLAADYRQRITAIADEQPD